MKNTITSTKRFRRAALTVGSATIAVSTLIMGSGVAYADPDTSSSPSASASPSASKKAKPEKDPGPDPCRNIGPEKRMPGPVTNPSAKPLPGADKQIVKGSDGFGLDGLLQPAAKTLGLSDSLPEGKLFPDFKVFDDKTQGEGAYNSKTQLQSGLVCAITDSLVETKVRRDVAQKVAQGLMATPTLLAGLEGPDIAALVQSGAGCAIAIAQAAAAAAASGASSGAAAAAAAPAAISAGPVCVAAGGDAARIAGKLINVWEHNPMFPQVAEFAAILNPDTEIGRKVYEKLPEPLQSKETIGLMKALSRFTLKLSEVWIGKTIAIFGDAVSKAAAGDTSAVPGAAMAAVELGMQVISAAAYTLTGKDELEFAGETIVDTKQLTKTMSTVVSGNLLRLPDEGTEVVSGGALGGGAAPGALPGSAQGGQQQQSAGQYGQYGGQQGTTTGGQQQTGSAPDLSQITSNVTGNLGGIMGTNTGAKNQGGAIGDEFFEGLGQNTTLSVDASQFLSSEDIQSVKTQVPSAITPPKVKKPDNGAIWGLDAKEPGNLLGDLPIIGAGGLFGGEGGLQLPELILPSLGGPKK